ncbi:caspase-9 [Austrofundulus limnaeus]|uniref:Caspase-9 n=1 Tax=Austrofundulus limnaeus TaxID=52670 RepID=A0A2I4AP08_AUSLI|nr:PREDICTED: caspase-9 [Austrofundulus limnaeus]
MDEYHKKILQKNRVNLVTSLDPSNLYDALLAKGVFTQDMIDEIKSSGTRRDQARQLVRDLETRGRRAFPIFLECLQETGQHGLVEILQNGAPPVRIQPATPTQVDRPKLQPLPLISPVDVDQQTKHILPVYPVKKPNTPTPSPGTDPLRPGPQGRPCRDSIQNYKMDASPCGHCLIINNVEFEPDSKLNNRNGSNVDCEKLERRFKALNFIVEVKTNLKQRQIKQALSTLSKIDHSQYDCCVVAMLSHGAEVNHNRFPGAVYGVDGQFIKVQQITNYLNGQNCPSLQGKPKLFFLQACGGGEKDIGFEVSPDEAQPSVRGFDDQTDAIPTSSSSDSLSASDEVDARASLPTPSDILVSYSTFPGFVSWRDPQAGSWYIETLDSILDEFSATKDLAEMLTMVNLEVSQNCAKGVFKQMPGYFNFLRKLLYFQTST